MGKLASSMRIFISIVRFEPGKTLGSEVYLRSLLKALSNIVKDEEVIIAASEKGVEWGRRIAPDFLWKTLSLPGSIVRRAISESLEIEKLAKQCRADVLFFPFNIMPKVSLPSVLLLHDLVNEFYSRKFPFYRPVYYQTVKALVRRSIRRADNLITISRFIADELSDSKFLQPHQRVFVAPLASQAVLPEKKRPEGFLKDNRRIILQTGEHLPHKSHITGLKAMSFLSDKHADVFENLHMVLTGGQIQNKELAKFVREKKIERNITFLGKVSGEELEWLIEEASLICFPTIYEGFGLGIIEAQMRGKPVLASDIAVLREVSGGNAVFFEPENHLELARKILDLYKEDFYYPYMVEKGLNNASKLGWESHAEKVLDVLKITANVKAKL